MPPRPSPEAFRQLGATGLNVFGGWIYEEYLPELSGERGRKVFREMAEQDPVIGGILFAIEMLIRQVPWQVVPADDSSEAEDVADFVDECFRDMVPSWPETLSEILSMLQFGWSWVEVVYKQRAGDSDDIRKKSRYDDGKIGWRKWAIRAQDTLNGWEYTDDGELTGFNQLAPPVYKETFIPRSKSIHFRTKARKDNPEGVSVLRNAYRPWYFKKHIETIEGIGVERDLAGLPVMWVPAELLSSGATDEQQEMLRKLQKIVTNIRRDEQEGLILPLAYDTEGREKYKLELLSSGGQRQFDTDKIVTRYDQRMAMTVLSDFILLGHEAVGSYALSSDKTALFAVAIGAWLDIITTAVTTQELPRLMKLNGIDLKKMPTLQHGDIETPDLGKLGDFISKLAAAGAILFPNPALEKALFEAAGLPLSEGGLAEDVPQQALPPTPAPGQPGQPAQPAQPGQQGPATQQPSQRAPAQQQPRAASEDDEDEEPFDFWAENNERGKKGFQPGEHSPQLELMKRMPPEGYDSSRLGKCYQLAGRYAAFTDQSAILVHGTIKGPGLPRLDHAWVETKDGIWEPATNQVWPKDVFKSVFNPRESRRYSHIELLERITSTEHWGPWESGAHQGREPVDDETLQFWANNNVQGKKGFQPKGSYDSMTTYSRVVDGKQVWDHGRVDSVHKPILDEIANQGVAVDPEGPVLYMTGGGYGSGKSTLLDSFPEVAGFPSTVSKGRPGAKAEATRVDPDAIKEGIPEFPARAAKGDKTAASYVHEESSYLSKQATMQSLKAGKDTVYDTSGDTGIAKLHAKVQQFRALGARRVVASYATPGSWREAVNRVNARAAAAKGARRDIPPNMVVANHLVVSRTWLGAAAKGTFDELNLFSTSGPFGSPPRLIARAVGGKIQVFDQREFDSFLTGGELPEGIGG